MKSQRLNWISFINENNLQIPFHQTCILTAMFSNLIQEKAFQ